MNHAPIWSVTGINEYLRERIDSDAIIQNVLVSGEISNFSVQAGKGHMYFTLKDNDNSIRAVMFRGNASRLTFLPADGMNVIVTASVGVYTKNGYCQLKVSDMQPDGLGAVYLATEQLRERLAAEGIFAEEHKKPIPKMPERIGLVMGAESAALGDVIEVITNRYPLVTLIVFPTLVEGDNAPASICGSVRRADGRDLDLIICGRGGGSLEALMAFNHESVVRCIYECNTPIITAVGHNMNNSLSDLAADRYFLTPTAAAKEAVPDRNDLLRQLFDMERRLKNVLSAKFNEKNHMLEIMSKRIEAASPMRRMALSAEKLQSCEKRLDDLYRMKLHKAETELSKRISRLDDSYVTKLNRAGAEISEKAARLDSLSPLKTMSRGYSLVYKGDRLISSVDHLSAGDEVNIRLSDGTISASVNRITK